MKFVLIGGNTDTARLNGSSAAGANSDTRVHTPSTDLEVVEYGHPVQAPTIPFSTSGCPTPAAITRAVRELLEFDLLAVDAGLARSTAAPTVTIGDEVGNDIRTSDPVASASDTFEASRRLGHSLPDEELVIGETISDSTTTALGVLTALGEQPTVSSLLPENPLLLKCDVVGEALDTSSMLSGSAAGNSIEAVRYVGDPVLAVVAGLTAGAADADKGVTLVGGTQMAAATALVRHAGTDASLSLATTLFIAADETAEIRELADGLDVALVVTNPGFDSVSHPAMDAYVAGEAKEGVGMGGALLLAAAADVSMAAVREKIGTVYDRLAGEEVTANA